MPKWIIIIVIGIHLIHFHPSSMIIRVIHLELDHWLRGCFILLRTGCMSTLLVSAMSSAVIKGTTASRSR